MNDFEFKIEVLDGEIFRPIKGYEAYYQVSNYGRVLALPNSRHKKAKFLKPLKNGKPDYLFVYLRTDKNPKGCLIHRLVAEAFLPKPEGYNEVNHINEDKHDNRAENLEWCTHKQNCNKGTRNARISATQRNNRRSKPVYQYTLDGVLVGYYSSGMQVQRDTKFFQSIISACVNGRTKTAYGYIWRHEPLTPKGQLF